MTIVRPITIIFQQVWLRFSQADWTWNTFLQWEVPDVEQPMWKIVKTKKLHFIGYLADMLQ